MLSSQCDSKSHRPCFHSYLSADESSIHLRPPMLVCVCLCMFVCTHRGACCASIFTASISDKPNESPENCYLPALLFCLVLLFSHSVFAFLISPPLAVCLPLSQCAQCGGFSPPSANKPLSVLDIVHTLHIHINSHETNGPRETLLLFMMWIR